ncbi:hypothetical protein F5Y16DRAFT_385448 [Xylariaceae sp. FL0255]|nr:hypothetical protein F5Y16DRAFT_385448 [Xylariaceae sp. FL0255]
MAEVIGVVAAASQLAGYCFRLAEGLYHGMTATRMLKEYKIHLDELKVICASIQNTPSLQTSQVRSFTSRIISVIDESDILEIITKPRFVRACIFVISRRSFSEFFQQLESYKISLSLYITTINSSHLGSLEEAFRNMNHPEERIRKIRPTQPARGDEHQSHARDSGTYGTVRADSSGVSSGSLPSKHAISEFQLPTPDK